MPRIAQVIEDVRAPFCIARCPRKEMPAIAADEGAFETDEWTVQRLAAVAALRILKELPRR
jgi:hypothetical protein